METKEKPSPKEKRRNNEKRKEKSRDAARSRRSKETEVFNDLASVLPVPHEIISQLDKASVMRLGISNLRIRDMAKFICPKELFEAEKNSSTQLAGSSLLKTMDGFLFSLSTDGDIVYVSENVSEFLGMSMIDLLGQNIYEFSHPCDHSELKDVLSLKSEEDTDDPRRSFFIRLKCTLTSKGRSVNLKSATYKVIKCRGRLLTSRKGEDADDEKIVKRRMAKCLLGVGTEIPHPSNIEILLPRDTFCTKHSMDMKFTQADDKILTDILGYAEEDLVGKSMFEYHHAMDSETLCTAFKNLHLKGQIETHLYRFLAKFGGYVWVNTQATIIYDNKMQKPQSIVCVTYVVSGVECKDEIYSVYQEIPVKPEKLCTEEEEEDIIVSEKVPPIQLILPIIKAPAPPVVEKVINETGSPPTSKVDDTDKFLSTTPQVAETGARTLTATSKIFAPRTQEMNKGYLTFSEDEPDVITMLKDEQDDLTHLAPVAGDVCVPLDESPFLTDMMLDDFLHNDGFGTLLEDDPTDPFISYRNSYDTSPQLLSPNLSKNSECSLPSLNSPSDSMSDEDRMSGFINLPIDDDSELVSKNAYYPVSVGEDLPLLMSDDLMWGSSDRSKKTPDNNSSLAQLLSSTISKRAAASLKTNDHGGGLLQGDQITYYNNKKNISKSVSSKIERSNKRSNAAMTFDSPLKRPKMEPKEKMSSELLQQLMSNNHHRGRPKGKSNWLLDSGGQKAACISQPSDSVLMNLLDDPMMSVALKREDDSCPTSSTEHETSRGRIRRNSLSLLNPATTAIPSLMDLTQQDFDVNAPVSGLLMNGAELLTALDLPGITM